MTRLFPRSYDLAPRPPSPPPLPSVSSTDDTQEDWERETTCKDGRRGEGDGRGAESYDCKKAWAFYKLFTTLCSLPPLPTLRVSVSWKNDKLWDIFLCVVLYHLCILLVPGRIMREPGLIRNWLRLKSYRAQRNTYKNYSENQIKYTLKKEGR